MRILHVETVIQMMEKKMTTMNTMKMMIWTMSMMLVSCQPVDLQDQEWHGYCRLAVV